MKTTLVFMPGIIFLKILMITLVSNQKSLTPNISAGIVMGFGQTSLSEVNCGFMPPQSKTNTNVISRQHARKCLTPLCEVCVKA